MVKPTQRMQRFSWSNTGVVVDTTTIASSTAVDYRNAAGGCLVINGDFTTVTYTFYGCDTIDGTFLPLYTSGGVAVTATGPGGSTDCMIELPTALFGTPYFKILTNADDTETLTVVLKS